MGEKWGFFLLFDAIIAHRCATMRYDSASPKTGAWPSLIGTICARPPSITLPRPPNVNIPITVNKCFSGTSTVQTERGKIPMGNLRLGDNVLTYTHGTGDHYTEVSEG